ncbi:hypothetical protein GCM10010116_46450 [Microbispora rosea subsp. aerata]|nr:hypothetical protein [Microbispora rosea]GGO23024.1 hypothetical protein GCM10010116_46450 [Microbispora rosea subsp. aerata]GIH57695.1 hypothetical protein Mro02_46090 [Microbispora rosea subsp. aerata]GLJ84062.1 hypothetical protein GCM10017588_27900 [Microbispora rosea subsp. aerata]
MTPPQDTTTNIAADDAQVGMQVGIVHGDVYSYVVAPDSPADKKFEAGMRFLEGGAAGRALWLIDKAIESGYVTNRVCFYWLLAMVSGRTRRELSAEETNRLRDCDRFLPLTGDDSWADGVRIIRRLLDAAEKTDADVRVLMKELDELRPIQRDMILRHMAVFLHGPLKDQMWDRGLQRAREQQMSGERSERVRKFFQPKPAVPRVREAVPTRISGPTWCKAVAGTLVFVPAAGYIGLLLIQGGRISALLAYILCVAAACFAAPAGVEWRFRSLRRRMLDEAYAPTPLPRADTPSDPLAKRIDHQLRYYLAKYVPDGMDREVWLTWTAGIRRRIRDEIADAYCDSGTKVDTFDWLIRHRASEVARRWNKGTLWSYRQELATPPRTAATAVLGTMAFAAGGTWAMSGAVQAGGLSVIAPVVLALAGGWIAGNAWLRIVLERRRYRADKADFDKLSADCEMAYRRWKDWLADTPDDKEMATWLDWDRKVLLSEALQQYRLKMSDVVAYAFIEARSGSATRARVRGGPWRYRKYDMKIFLITADGVRQYNARLHFDDGTFHDRNRLNYRFEAVTAVHVQQADDNSHTFELSLMDGQKITAQMIGPELEEQQQPEDPEDVSEVSLDAAGLHHTLHVLEGVAAEGKAWMTRERAATSQDEPGQPAA